MDRALARRLVGKKAHRQLQAYLGEHLPAQLLAYLEQCPADLCTIADYDALTALFAPRPSLLIYNRHDDCCFQTARARRSIYQPAKKVFELLGAGENIELYDNIDPGTHNYAADNRRQLYRFLNRRFGLDTPEDDLPWKEELYSEAELEVGLPHDNATLHSLAQDALRAIRVQHKAWSSTTAARRRLATLLKLERRKKTRVHKIGNSQKRKAYVVRHYQLDLAEEWTLPITELAPPHARGVDLLIADMGREALRTQVATALEQGRRVFVADIFGSGELSVSWQHHMLISTAGKRSLGLQVGQLLALLDWAKDKLGPPNLRAAGPISSVVALIACAIRPTGASLLQTNGLLDSLGRLIDWPQDYSKMPSLFCFGLLAEFDINDLIELAAPLPLSDGARGPLR